MSTLREAHGRMLSFEIPGRAKIDVTQNVYGKAGLKSCIPGPSKSSKISLASVKWSV